MRPWRILSACTPLATLVPSLRLRMQTHTAEEADYNMINIDQSDKTEHTADGMFNGTL